MEAYPFHPTASTATSAISAAPTTISYDPAVSDAADKEAPAKPNLKAVLKTILLKDYYHRPEDSLPTPASSAQRPTMMRMKDSDDYITARGANPRTGIISPSVGTRTPVTPDSPGDALKLRKAVHVTPCPTVTRTPSRANQGRKISGHNRRVSTHRTQLYTAEHALSDEEAEADNASQHSVPKDDQFVVHMPSAREPQPFAYPGYTEQQIEALEHYRQKARRTSSEGYDHRLISDRAVPGAFEAYRHHEVRMPSPSHHEIIVRKRKHTGIPLGMEDQPQHTSLQAKKTPKPGAKSTALLSPPFTSPKIRTINRLGQEGQESLSHQEAYCQNTKSHAQRSLRKAIGSAPRPAAVAVDDHFREEDKRRALPSLPPDVDMITRSTNGCIREDLSRLPRVRLVRDSELTADKPTRGEDVRKCSLGCEQHGGECLQQRRNASTGTVIHRRSCSNEFPTGSSIPSSSTKSAEIVLGVTYSLLAYLQTIRVPKSAQIEVLMSPDASMKEKAEALQAILSMAAHLVAACTILAMLWKLGVAVMHFMEVLLWPLAVPLRVLRWVGGGGGGC